MTRRMIGRALAAALMSAALAGCSSLENLYLPVATVPLQGPAAGTADNRCDAPADPSAPPPQYVLEQLRDCTSKDSLVLFAFSGGGIRSASFGYGALGAAHGTRVPDAAGVHTLDSDIDIISGVSGGSYTAAAFANKRGALFPETGKPDHYRDKFLTHNFFGDMISIWLAPWRWQWMFPHTGWNDQMAKIYADVNFSEPGDKLFAKTFGDLARKGRPLLVVQATDFGNEQPFTFTQNDFDLICSDVNTYPVGNAIAASTAFPVLFSPIRLTNHHHSDPAPDAYCARHRPQWVDEVLSQPEPSDLSRRYARALRANDYLPPAGGRPAPKNGDHRHVFLQDGGVADNMALRGMTNIVVRNFDNADSGQIVWNSDAAASACRAGLDRVRRILVVAVDGQAQPNNQIASMPYLGDLALIFNTATSAAIDANGFETMLATDALTRRIAAKLSVLSCEGAAQEPRSVMPYFAHVSFQDLAQDSPLDAAACGKSEGEVCTLGHLARSDTSLDFSGAQVDALIRAGNSAFRCNRKIGEFLKDVNALADAGPSLACRRAVSPP